MSSNDDTSPGPPPDSDHPPKEDTLLERGAEDALDEGYSPPDREPGPHWGETPYEQVVGEPMAEELAEEEPEPEEQQPDDASLEADRAGRLADLGESEVAEDVAWPVAAPVPRRPRCGCTTRMTPRPKQPIPPRRKC